jgi:hypothetical protein
MTRRRRFVMFVAGLLGVKLYNHWSEIPIDVPRATRCSKKGCKQEAHVNRLGKPFCCDHDRAITRERLRTGRIGPVLEHEGMEPAIHKPLVS